MASVADVARNPLFENRVLGTVYGNCIGDAIGLLTEFMTKSEAEKVCRSLLFCPRSLI